MAIPASPVHRDGPQPAINFRAFLILVVLIISAAILRSAIATRLDGFALDEPYHIVAGVSYVQRADFRINPEHPPLVKLWVGSIISTLGFHLTPFREIHDKYDERSYTNDNVWTHEANPEALQHHARVAMWIFNGALLFLFTLALHRVFGPIVALGTLLFLAIEPFVAANLPVVMTDLPIALLGTTAVVLASRAFVTWIWPTWPPALPHLASLWPPSTPLPSSASSWHCWASPSRSLFRQSFRATLAPAAWQN